MRLFFIIASRDTHMNNTEYGASTDGDIKYLDAKTNCQDTRHSRTTEMYSIGSR